MTYVELQVATHFSFLRGVSSAEELFSAAGDARLSGARHHRPQQVGGLVKALRAADATGVRLVAGCRLDLMDGSALLVWPEDRAAWSRLTRLLTHRQEPGRPQEGREGPMLPPLGGCRRLVATAWSRLWSPTKPTGSPRSRSPRWPTFSATRGHLALTHRRRPGELKRLHALDALARRHGLRSLATGDVLYDGPDKRMLQDVVTAIREHVTIDELGFRRERFADRYLKSPEEMERRFSAFPDAVRATADIAERCTFSLARAQLPISRRDRDVGPHAAGGAGAADPDCARRQSFPAACPRNYADLLEHELKLVGQLGLRALFPHRQFDRPVRPQPEDPLPGPRLGRQFDDLLRARHHLDRSDRAQACCSSASSPTTATSRPTSTSISSMSGARR